MEKVEVFELEDDFDPLADAGLELETDEEYAGGIEYQAPIPDADKSVVPEAVELPPAERIDKLVAGIPGQKFRILSAIKICGEAKTLEVAADELEEAYPQGTSVYDAIRIIELLHDAGALVCVDEEGNEIDLDAVAEEVDEAGADADAAVAVAAAADEDAEEARVDAISLDELDVEYDEVEKEAPVFYLATEAGKDAVERMWSASAAFDVVNDEPQYLPVWKKVLQMCSEEGGATKKAVADALDAHPILQEPRRWCQYFLEKLKNVNALEFDTAWVITDIGKQLLADEIFADVEAAEIDGADNADKSETN
jgi:hypothetical protein